MIGLSNKLTKWRISYYFCTVAPERIWNWGEGQSSGEKVGHARPLFRLYKSPVSCFGERLRDGQYSLLSFLFAVLLLTVLLCPAIHKSGGTCPRAIWGRRLCFCVQAYTCHTFHGKKDRLSTTWKLTVVSEYNLTSHPTHNRSFRGQVRLNGRVLVIGLGNIDHSSAPLIVILLLEVMSHLHCRSIGQGQLLHLALTCSV